MKLRVFLVVHELEREKVAKDLDISYNYFNSIIRGIYQPSKKLARKISEYTKGEVTIDELRPKKMVDK